MTTAPRCPHCGGKAEQMGPTLWGVRRMRCTKCTRHFTVPKTMTIEQLVSSLTREHAIEWDKQTDQLMWVETTLLDPHNLPRSDRNIAAVEDRLTTLL